MDGLAPKAWSEWFIVRPVGDELLVYDLRTQKVTSLNRFAANVWQTYDDGTEVGALVAGLTQQGIDVDDPAAVDLALAMLRGAQLLPPLPARRNKRQTGDNRRGFIRRFFSGAAAVTASTASAAPAVISIVAPSPAEAASPCTRNSQCAGATPVCSVSTHTCVQCASNANCANPTPICTSGTCKSCTSTSQCPVGFACMSGSCSNDGSCTTNSQCSGATPFCNTASHQCVECIDNSSCEDPFYPFCQDHSCSG